MSIGGDHVLIHAGVRSFRWGFMRPSTYHLSLSSIHLSIYPPIYHLHHLSIYLSIYLSTIYHHLSSIIILIFTTNVGEDEEGVNISDFCGRNSLTEVTGLNITQRVMSRSATISQA